MIDRYFRDRAALKLVVVLTDARRGPEDMELDLVQYFSEIRTPAVPYVFVATKIDKLPKSLVASSLQAASKKVGGRALGFSATTGYGRNELWRVLLSSAETCETEASYA